MKTFTRADVLSWRPCYSKTKTLRIMRGLPRKMTALDVLRHEAATPADRLWCVLRSDVLSDRTLRLFAAWCGRGALDAERTARREPDPRSWAAVDVAERYALGQATDGELRAARAAARAADDDARDAYAAAAALLSDGRSGAVGASSSAAAHAAATRAAYAAAYAAADAAADAAARAAARATDAASAARAAARAAQVARLVELIEEEN